MNSVRHTLRSGVALALVASAAVLAQSPTLHLPFEHSFAGQDGEIAISTDGVKFARGAIEFGGSFGDSTNLRYDAAGNILATEGTLEFWVKPSWNGADGTGHAFLHWGASSGGMIVLKDGANNLRGIFNQYGPGGKPEMGVGYNINSWAANRWHHVAITWSTAAHELRLSIDGVQKNQASLTADLPLIGDTSFRVGSGWGGNESRSVLDEYRIYDTARSASQIGADYAADLTLHPSLALSFEDSLIGEDSESPTAQFGITYGTGAVGRGVQLLSPTQLSYGAAGNIRSDEGTIEFWVKPSWNGNDGANRTFLSWGSGGGMLFAKDAASNLRGIFSRYGSGGIPEVGVAAGVGDWVNDQWHHLAYTWSNTGQRVALFVDGQLRDERTLTQNLPSIATANFSVGRDGTGSPLAGTMDELRVYPFARTDSQIAQDMTYDLQIQSISILPASDTIYPSWQAWPRLYGQTQLSTVLILNASAQWESSDPSVVAIEPGGVPRAIAPGTATITATFAGKTATMDLTVAEPARAPEEPPAQPFLTEPAIGAVYELPVLSIRFVPTNDGFTVDEARAGYAGNVSDVIDWINTIEVETKFMLEEGGRFRGYANPGARPSIGYRVVRTINIFEPIPPDRNDDHRTGSEGVYFPDYNSILARLGLQDLVENQGVREVWLWGYHNGEIAPVESNMASALTGDISNSNRFPDDLPIFSHTYTLYNYNWTRSSNEAVHDHGHQIEALLSAICNLQDMNTDLFWKRFVGQDDGGNFITGRCGWTHMPPNTINHYDYENYDVVPSDIFAWTPAGGPTTDLNADTWGQLQYAWPSGNPPAGLIEHNWYIFWMQSLPGLDSGIPHDIGVGSMSNWWSFVGDWDRQWGQVDASFGLHTVDFPPIFTTEPPSGQACLGSTVVLAAGVMGEALSYRWRAGDEWIGDGPTGNGSVISGAFTPTLTIENFQREDAVSFVCVATSGIGSTWSWPAVVTFCAADFTCDGIVEDSDFVVFVGEYNTLVCDDPSMPPGCPADLNRDGLVDDADFVLFVVAYNNLLCE